MINKYYKTSKSLIHRIEIAYKQSPMAIFAAIFAAVTLVLIMRPQLSDLFFYSWTAAFIIHILGRSYAQIKFNRDTQKRKHFKFWLITLYFFMLCSGVLWGSILYMAISQGEIIRNFAILWVTALVIGGSSTASAFPSVFLSFAICTLFPSIVTLLLMDDPMLKVTGIGLLIIFCFISLNMFILHRSLIDMILLKKENSRAELRLQKRHKMDAIAQLTAGISHNYNNLLTIIIGNIELLRPCVHTENQEYVDCAMEAAMDASQLTDKLNSFSHKQDMQKTIVNLKELMSHFFNIMEPLLSNNINFSSNLHYEDLYIYIDPTQLEIALTNIILNAKEATQEGGKVIIRTRVKRIKDATESDDDDTTSIKNNSGTLPEDLKSGEYAEIIIMDDGVGIDNSIILKIFDPFFTTKSRSNSEGLGLSISKGIIEQCNGGIHIESNEETTRVHIYLPLINDDMIESEISQYENFINLYPGSVANMSFS
jgi:signal transduction histidine kinase